MLETLRLWHEKCSVAGFILFSVILSSFASHSNEHAESFKGAISLVRFSHAEEPLKVILWEKVMVSSEGTG